jgi:Kef-type K+ transport system membrane component KefB
MGSLAMALVLFNMGCHFTFVHFRRIRARVARLATGEMLTTFLLVTIAMLLLGTPFSVSALFGILAVATAPATTILVLKESESEGPITEYASTLVAINNLVAIVAFECVFVMVQYSKGHLTSPIVTELATLCFDLIGSVSLGVLAGLVTAYNCGLFRRERWLVVLVAIATAVLGLCELRDLPYLLTFLAMGVTVANASDKAEEIVDELGRLTGLLCVVFFVVHGAEMDLNALRAAGVIGVGYIIFRTIGKWLGIYFTADNHLDGPHTREWLGASLLSQAGAAIALSALAVRRDPELGETLQTVILGTVVFFEIVGPILVRQAVLHGGEIPLDRAIVHRTTTAWEELKSLWRRVLIALGRDTWVTQSPDKFTVGQLTKTNVKGIASSADFSALAEWIENSHDNIFPVIGNAGQLVGIIRYMDVRDNVFDPDLVDLVCAADLAVEPQLTLSPSAPLTHALEYFRHGADDAIPVTDADGGQYIGLVRRKDLIRFFRRGGLSAQ